MPVTRGAVVVRQKVRKLTCKAHYIALKLNRRATKLAVFSDHVFHKL